MFSSVCLVSFSPFFSLCKYYTVDLFLGMHNALAYGKAQRRELLPIYECASVMPCLFVFDLLSLTGSREK